MPKVSFTSALERFVACPTGDVDGETVRAALEAAFALNPPLRGYVLDDAGRLRKHVTVFVDGRPVADRDGLADSVGARTEIFVMQALSGG